MFAGKIKLDKDLLAKAKTYAENAGYSSVEEFVAHLIERELSASEKPDESEEEMKKRLEGLGYIS